MGAEYDIAEIVGRERASGAVRSRIRASGTEHGCGRHVEIADELVKQSGLRGLGPGWTQVDLAEAHSLLSTAIASDLCTERELVDPERAAELAKLFLSPFSATATLLTNGRLALSGGIKVWAPLSTGFFDTGVAAIGERTARILWIEDALTDDSGEARAPWALARASRPSLENRLRRLLQALGEGHPLAGATATAIAGRMDQDCTLFSLGDGAEEALLVDLW